MEDFNEIDDALLAQVENIENPKKEEVQTTTSAPAQEEAPAQVEPQPENEAASFIGKKLSYTQQKASFDKENKKMVEDLHLSKIGDNIGQNALYREGWIDLDKRLLGERAVFYPESWQFRIRPATVEAIRNWSTLDEENFTSIDDVLTEVLKACVSIVSPSGPIPVGNICIWDRFFFVLIAREYTFTRGECKIEYEEDCIECSNPVKFNLTSDSLMFEMPDEEVMPMYNQEERCWEIDPEEYEVYGQAPIKLYVPTVDKNENIKAWMIQRLQENRNRKIDQTFLKFAIWLAPKIAKDPAISQKQIRELEMIYKGWDTIMFSFMDDVVRNIIVTPSTKLKTTCPVCGEEQTSEIRFPNSIRDLFNVSGRFKKFGKK